MKTDRLENSAIEFNEVVLQEIKPKELTPVTALDGYKDPYNPPLFSKVEPLQIIKLDGRWAQIISKFRVLGTVKMQTWHGNSCVEQVGVYPELSAENLRYGTETNNTDVFSGNWNDGYALIYSNGQVVFRFYSDSRLAHQVVVSDDIDSAVLDALIDRFKQKDELNLDHFDQLTESKARKTNGYGRRGIDLQAFKAAWLTLRNSYELDRLVERYRLKRKDALMLAGDAWATRISVSSFLERMHLFCELELPYVVMLQNGNLRHSVNARVNQIEDGENLIRFQGDDFSFFISQAEIESAWLITLPNSDKAMSFIECCDDSGQLLMQIHSDAGITEAAIWQDMVNTLPALVA